jgi:hypothetical protein
MMSCLPQMGPVTSESVCGIAINGWVGARRTDET